MVEELGKFRRTQSWTRLHNATLNALSMSNIRSGSSSSGVPSSSSYGGSMMAAAGASSVSPSSSYTASHAHGGHSHQQQQQQQQHPYGTLGRSNESSRTTSPYHSRATTPAASRRNSPASSAVDLSLPPSASCSGVATPAVGHAITVTYTPALPTEAIAHNQHTEESGYEWPMFDPTLSPMLASLSAVVRSTESSTPPSSSLAPASSAVGATPTGSAVAGDRAVQAHPFETTTYVLGDQEVQVANARISPEQLAAWRVDIDKATVSRVAMDSVSGSVVGGAATGSSPGSGSGSGSGAGGHGGVGGHGTVRGLQRRMLLVRREK